MRESSSVRYSPCRNDILKRSGHGKYYLFRSSAKSRLDLPSWNGPQAFVDKVLHALSADMSPYIKGAVRIRGDLTCGR